MAKKTTDKQRSAKWPGPPRPGKPMMGRPPIDPADLRTVRFSFRLHPDLYSEIQRIARLRGQPASILTERALINEVHREVGRDILELHGRYRLGAAPKK